MNPQIDPVFTNKTISRVYEIHGKETTIDISIPQELELLPLGPQIIDAMFDETVDKLNGR